MEKKKGEIILLAADKVSCGYGKKQVVRDVGFTVKAGSWLCIAGPNGCGKSTLLKALCGLLPYEGTVTFHGKEISAHSRRELSARVALMAQLQSLSFDYSVRETVRMGRYAAKKRGFFSPLRDFQEDWEAADAQIQALGLEQEADQSILRLSGGQLQRVFLARTLAQEPDLILLDEPTNHLDVKHQAELVDGVRSWLRQEGRDRAAVSVFHDLNLAAQAADEILLMKQGRAAAFGPAGEVLSSPVLSEAYDFPVREYMRGLHERWL